MTVRNVNLNQIHVRIKTPPATHLTNIKYPNTHTHTHYIYEFIQADKRAHGDDDDVDVVGLPKATKSIRHANCTNSKVHTRTSIRKIDDERNNIFFFFVDVGKGKRITKGVKTINRQFSYYIFWNTRTSM